MRVMLPRGATKAFNGTKLPKNTRHKHDNRTKTGNLVRFGPRLRHRSLSKARLGAAICRHAPTCPGHVPAAGTLWQGSPGGRPPQAMKKTRHGSAKPPDAAQQASHKGRIAVRYRPFRGVKRPLWQRKTAAVATCCGTGRKLGSKRRQRRMTKNRHEACRVGRPANPLEAGERNKAISPAVCRHAGVKKGPASQLGLSRKRYLPNVLSKNVLY